MIWMRWSLCQFYEKLNDQQRLEHHHYHHHKHHLHSSLVEINLIKYQQEMVTEKRSYSPPSFEKFLRNVRKRLGSDIMHGILITHYLK